MVEYQITRWRTIPSMISVREDDLTLKAQLSFKFQDAIDRAAMTLGEQDSETYLMQWARDEWMVIDESPEKALDTLVKKFEEEYTQGTLEAIIEKLVNDN